jgi:hypothetical protein
MPSYLVNNCLVKLKVSLNLHPLILEQELIHNSKYYQSGSIQMPEWSFDKAQDELHLSKEKLD